MTHRNCRDRSGIGAGEAVVCLVIVLVVVLLILAAIPRQRETARVVGCRRNLKQIGDGLGLYHQATGHLPAVPALGEAEAARGPGPLGSMLDELGLPNFLDLTDPTHPPPRRPGAPTGERPVPGFTCTSDRNTAAGLFPAPISYRAVTGYAPDGRDGPFAPGRRVTIAEIEEGDGLGYTSAFVERLVGDGRSGSASLANYARVPGPIPAEGCPSPPADSWRGDAGSSWIGVDWRSTLANHALTPNASPSCIAADGRTALMGASSAHADQVHALMLDGSVRPYTPRVDPKVWRALANARDRPRDDLNARPEVAPAESGRRP